MYLACLENFFCVKYLIRHVELPMPERANLYFCQGKEYYDFDVQKSIMYFDKKY